MEGITQASASTTEPRNTTEDHKSDKEEVVMEENTTETRSRGQGSGPARGRGGRPAAPNRQQNRQPQRRAPVDQGSDRYHPYRQERGQSQGQGQSQSQSQSQSKGIDFDSTYQAYRVVRDTAADRIAALLSSSARRGECPSFMAIGPVCNMLMVRGIIIARDYLLQDQIELLVNSEFVVVSNQLSAIKYSITKSARRKTEHHIDVTLKAAQGTDVKQLAGAVASNIRLGKRVAISAVGADSLNQALKAYTISRGYVEQNNLDLSYIAEVVAPDSAAPDVSPFRLVIFAQQI